MKRLLLSLLLLVTVCCNANAADAKQIDAQSRAALRQLFHANAKARYLGNHALAVLVFPQIIKGGFMVGGMHGTGALIARGGTVGYYRTAAASYGLQAGIQTFGYAIFFMSFNSLEHLHEQGGWEIGTAPSLVILDSGISHSMNTTQLKGHIYAVFFNQQGLMGGLGLQGSKITEIHPK